MYIVLVAPSGGRKGTAMNFALHMLDELGIKLASEAITREALIRELKNSGAAHTDKTGRMFHHASLTIFSPELTVFLGYQNKQLMSDMTDWYDCRDRWTYRTKNAGTDEIIGVWVNLIGGTTPDLVRETLPQEAIGGGLTSRIIFVYANKKAHKVVFPDAPEELYRKLLNDLEDIHMMSGEFKIDPSFIDHYTEWYMTESDTPLPDPRFGGYVERRANHLLKLSMILAASRSRDMILLGSDFKRAVSLLYEVEPLMLEVFQGMGRNPMSEVAMRILQKIRAEGEVEGALLTELFYHDAKTGELDETLGAFCRMGKIERITRGPIISYRMKGDRDV